MASEGLCFSWFKTTLNVIHYCRRTTYKSHELNQWKVLDFTDQISQGCRRSPMIILFNLAWHFRIIVYCSGTISFLNPDPAKSSCLCYSFLPPCEPLKFFQNSLTFGWIRWPLLEGKAEHEECGWDKKETRNTDLLEEHVHVVALLHLSQQSCIVCGFVHTRLSQLRHQLQLQGYSSCSQLTTQGRCLFWPTLQCIRVWLWLLTFAMGLCITALSYYDLWEFIQQCVKVIWEM